MNISKSKFNQLSEGEKAAYVLNHGKQITTKKEGKKFANLFSMEEFLVEVWYDSEDNQILSIEIIEDSDVLDSYIDAARSDRK